jgi:hypothetical protein
VPQKEAPDRLLPDDDKGEAFLPMIRLGPLEVSSARRGCSIIRCERIGNVLSKLALLLIVETALRLSKPGRILTVDVWAIDGSPPAYNKNMYARILLKFLFVFIGYYILNKKQ